jgi:putative flippase GtrA
LKTLQREMLRYIAGALLALFVDIALVSFFLSHGMNLLVARTFGLLAGVTITYYFNRRYTFLANTRPSFREWLTYASLQSIGTAINFAVSLIVLSFSSRDMIATAISIGFGAVAGFCYNFFAARKVLKPKQITTKTD